MIYRLFYIICFFLTIAEATLFCQTDDIPPDSPIMELVTVDNTNGTINVSWSKSTAADVKGYVVYNYQNNEGYAIDTINDPNATSYNEISIIGATYFSQSFVVAAFDTAGNISPLSNELSTIYIDTKVDSCKKIINISWNEYPSYPKNVTAYELSWSTDARNWSILATTNDSTQNFSLFDFKTGRNYYYKVKAILEDNLISESNETMANTKMQNPPEWINADYATIGNSNKVELSFSIDPKSEITTYNIERKEYNTENFSMLTTLTPLNNSIRYTDNTANTNQVYYYRLAAINNCENPIFYSNVASNIVLHVNQPDANTINLSWNRYEQWQEEISEQWIMVNTGYGFEGTVSLQPTDTSATMHYDSIMEKVLSNEICFTIKSIEGDNPRGINNISTSQQVCIPILEQITVPNMFTPDGNMTNDYFRPVLSFIPTEYYLLITDMNRHKVFETKDFNDEWDGQSGNRKLPEGTYLWMLRVTTPTSKIISKTGTVNILFNP